MDDMFRKRSKKSRDYKGENAPAHKLTNRDVIEIRDLYKHRIIMPTQLSMLYDVSLSNIWCVVKNRTFIEI
jgi:hypothetical protein